MILDFVVLMCIRNPVFLSSLFLPAAGSVSACSAGRAGIAATPAAFAPAPVQKNMTHRESQRGNDQEKEKDIPTVHVRTSSAKPDQYAERPKHQRR